MFARTVGRNAQRITQNTQHAASQRAQTRLITSQTKATPKVLKSSVSFAIYGLTSAATGAAAAWYSLRSQGMGFYSDEDSLSLFTPEDADKKALHVEATINKHPLVAELRSRSDLSESRPHMKMPAQYRARSLTGGTLLGGRRLPVPPYVWSDNHGKEMVSVAYIGEDLCGHPGIVHGGLLATMLDEGLARCCFKALPHNIAVTANLNIDYRKPTPAGSFVVLRAETTKVEGRKAWVKGRLELMGKPGDEPVVFAEATALFISPKFAAMMPKVV